MRRLLALRCRRTATIQGDPSVKLDSYRADAPFEVSADTLAAATDPALSIPTVSDCA